MGKQQRAHRNPFVAWEHWDGHLHSSVTGLNDTLPLAATHHVTPNVHCVHRQNSARWSSETDGGEEEDAYELVLAKPEVTAARPREDSIFFPVP